MAEDETITIIAATDDEARMLLAAKLDASNFESFGAGMFWELDGQTISVLLTEAHNDVFFFGGESTFRLHYATPQLLLGDWDVLMGIEDPEDVQEIHEAVEDPAEMMADYQVDAGTRLAEPEVRSGF